MAMCISKHPIGRLDSAPVGMETRPFHLTPPKHHHWWCQLFKSIVKWSNPGFRFGGVNWNGIDPPCQCPRRSVVCKLLKKIAKDEIEMSTNVWSFAAVTIFLLYDVHYCLCLVCISKTGATISMRCIL